MKSLSALLAVVVLGLATIACGSAGKATSSTSRQATDPPAAVETPASAVSTATPSGDYLKDDGDPDTDSENPAKRPGIDDDRGFLNAHGKETGGAERRAVTAVVKRYFVASAAGDGAQACTLLVRALAHGLAETESPSGQGAGSGCAASMSRIFSENRQQLASEDVSTMVVGKVRSKGDSALAVVGFKTAPEGEMPLQREGRDWKIAALINGQVP